MAEVEDFSRRAADLAAETAADVTEAEQTADRRTRIARFFHSAGVKNTALSGAGAAGRGARAVVSGGRAVATGRGARAVADRGRVVATGRGARAVKGGSRVVVDGGRRGSGWLADQVVAMVPRLRVRDQAALRVQFPGQSPDQIATALIEGAAKAAAAVGGAAGLWAVVPVVTAYPVEVAAETLVVVGIEVKLVAELHEAFGLPADGNVAERMRTYLAAWSHRRGVFMIPGGVVFAPGSPLARLLRRRLIARAGRSTASLGPLLTGAVAGAVLNRSAVRSLGRDIVRDLRRHDPIAGRSG